MLERNLQSDWYQFKRLEKLKEMKDYIPPSFEEKELEITNAISTLKRHGINIQLPENLSKQFAAKTLFDGDDGLFKELIKHTNIYYEYGCGKSTEFVFKYSSATIFSVDTSNDWVIKIKSWWDCCAYNRIQFEFWY